MIAYEGKSDGHTVEVVNETEPFHEELPMSDLGRQKSPTGFAWGYGGSGPAALAHSILTHFAGDGVAARHYQTFKSDCIAKLVQDQPFQIWGSQINGFLVSVNEKPVEF